MLILERSEKGSKEKDACGPSCSSSPELLRTQYKLEVHRRAFRIDLDAGPSIIIRPPNTHTSSTVPYYSFSASFAFL